MLLVCERIKQSLQDHFSDLENATKHCIEKLSSQLYSKGLVTVAVREAPACSKIHDELKAGLEQMKHFTPLKIHYQKFLECLSAQGGPSKGVSDQLREEWEEIKQKYEEVSRGGERGKSDLVTNKQLSVILDQQVKQQDEKMEIMKKDFESRLKEKEEVTERLNTELKETQEEKRLLQEKVSNFYLLNRIVLLHKGAQTIPLNFYHPTAIHVQSWANPIICLHVIPCCLCLNQLAICLIMLTSSGYVFPLSYFKCVLWHHSIAIVEMAAIVTECGSGFYCSDMIPLSISCMHVCYNHNK